LSVRLNFSHANALSPETIKKDDIQRFCDCEKRILKTQKRVLAQKRDDFFLDPADLESSPRFFLMIRGDTRALNFTFFGVFLTFLTFFEKKCPESVFGERAQEFPILKSKGENL